MFNLSNYRAMSKHKCSLFVLIVMLVSANSCTISGCKLRLINLFQKKPIETYSPSKREVKKFHLQLAIKEGDAGQIKDILAEFPDLVNDHFDDGWTPIHHAVMLNKPAIITILLNMGADVNIKGLPVGDTPLHHAARRGFMEILRMLVNSGANINATDNQFFTPLDYAIKANKTDAIKFLSDNKAKKGAEIPKPYVPHIQAE